MTLLSDSRLSQNTRARVKPFAGVASIRITVHWVWSTVLLYVPTQTNSTMVNRERLKFSGLPNHVYFLLYMEKSKKYLTVGCGPPNSDTTGGMRFFEFFFSPPPPPHSRIQKARHIREVDVKLCFYLDEKTNETPRHQDGCDGRNCMARQVYGNYIKFLQTVYPYGKNMQTSDSI